MTVQPCEVTGVFQDSAGMIMPDLTIEFRRRGRTVGDGIVILPVDFTYTTDSTGTLVADFYPGEYTGEFLSGYETVTFRFTVPSETTANLADLVDQLATFQPSLYIEISEARVALSEFTEVYRGNLATAPTEDLAEGQLYYDTTLDRLRVYTNGAWNTIESVTLPVPIASGGHGGTTAAEGRTNLGLGTMATQDASNYTALSVFNALLLRENLSSTVTATSGTGNAFTLTTGESLSSLITNYSFAIQFDRAPTGASTIAIDGLASIPIKTYNYGSATLVDTPADHWNAGDIVVGYYDGTQLIVPRNILLPQVTDNDDLSVNPDALPVRSNVKTYVDGLSIGVGQTPQDVFSSRAVDTSYQNTTGRTIMVSVGYAPTTSGTDLNSNPTTAIAFEVSLDDSTWVTIAYAGNRYPQSSIQWPVGPDHYYRVRKIGTGNPVINFWAELS